MTKKKLFANNWKEYRDTPAELFPEVPFEEYMDWRVHGWEILPTHCCVIRASTNTGKVKEYVYKTDLGAKRKIKKLMDDGTSGITVCSVDNVHYIKPQYEDDYYDDEEEEEPDPVG